MGEEVKKKMATLKKINASATVAFAPMASMLATGTMAGAIDPSFSSSASLDILQLDFANTSQDLPVLKSCPTSERFNRLSWANSGGGSEEYSLGIIAGGLADGSINLWNPSKLVSDDTAEPTDSVIARLEKHSGAVLGLEFSPVAPHLLASGAEDGDLFIWDVKDPAAPTHYPPLQSGDGGQGAISYVSWNRKVQPILAATSYSGTSVVWDLRKQKPVISFTDPKSRRRCSALQWHPDNATQLVVSSDDDRSPSLQVWDLRNSVSPLKELVGHSKGVLAMAWCPIDSSLLLACGKDNLTLCWDVPSGEVLHELPPSSNWSFDVQWSPRIPGVLSTSSFDGNTSIYNIEACSRTPSNEVFDGEVRGTGAAAVKKAPKWLKRPVGVSFGFGGKLVTYGLKKATPGVAGPTKSEIRLHSLVTEEELVKQSSEFEAAIAGGEKPVLHGFCVSKAEKAENEDDKETWNFLKVMFEDDARRKLLTHLNFEVSPIESEVQESEVQESEDKADSEEMDPVQSIEADSSEGQELQVSPLENDDSLLEGGEEDFFDNLKTPRTPQLIEQRVEALNLDRTTDDGDDQAESGFEVESTDESEESVQRALIVGDFKAAVRHCLAADRVADALILAYVGGSSLWEATQNDYIKKTGRPYLKVLSAVVNNDLRSLVEKRPLKAWKETLALLCTYAQSQDWTLLSDALAARLDSAKQTQAATLCYICSGNIEKAAEIWSRSLEQVSGGRSYVDALQTLMEKVVVLSLATGQKRLSPSLTRLVKQYVELLVSQGLLTTAQEYLSLVSADESPFELSVLQDRIYGSGASDAPGGPPSAPWESEPLQLDTRPTLSALSAPSQDYPPVEEMSFSSAYYPSSAAPAPSPRSFQTGTSLGVVEPPPRVYPPAETNSSYYSDFSQPGVPSSGYGSSALYPPQPPTSYNTATSNLGGYYSNPSAASDAWYPSRNTDRPPFTPGVPSQPFTPSIPSQPFTPGAASQPFTPAPFTPSAPSQTFVPPQTFVPSVPPQGPTAQPLPPPTMQTFMPISPRQQAGSALSGSTAQNASPQLTSTPAPVAPPAPAPTVQTADTSNVSAELKPVVASLTRLFEETSEAAGGSRANPAKRRELDNNSKKFGALFSKLNTADISANASSKLIQLCQALDVGNYPGALQIQVDLTTSDWDECSVWLTALKQMIKVRQALR